MYVQCIYIHVHGIYMYMYVMFIYLYSTACLYNRSSEGVNLFCCSSSIVGRKPLSNAAVCDILLPVVATGTGSLLSNECSLHKKNHQKNHHLPDRDCPHPHSPLHQRAEGHLHPCDGHENLLRQLVKVVNSETMYIHCMLSTTG